MNYTLISAPNNAFPLSPSLAALAPGEVAEGWAASFYTTPTSLGVRFLSVPAPEPSAAMLLLSGLLPLLARRRRSRRV